MANNQTPLLAALKHLIAAQGLAHTYWVAFSGGLDSHVLLDLCYVLRQSMPQLQLKTIHIEHGLSPNTTDWSLHCNKVATDYGIAHVSLTLNSKNKPTHNIEANLREQRYARLASVMQAQDILLTAHHADDQAETVLLQLLRGASIKGLAAMPASKSFAEGLHMRPLLSFTRDTLHAYAVARELHWIEDESNQLMHYARNYLRHDIMPRLKARWPGAAETLSRSATHAAEVQQLLDVYTQNDYLSLQGSKPQTLSLQRLLQLEAAKQRWMLRTWIIKSGYPLPNSKKMQTILQSVLKARADRLPKVSWDKVTLRRYQDNLYLLPHQQTLPQEMTWLWDFKTPLALGSIGVLHAKLQLGVGIKQSLSAVNVRWRKGGEKIRVCNAKCKSKYVKNIFQENKLPPWERETTPLLFDQQTLIAITGHTIACDYQAHENELGWHIWLEKNPPNVEG